MVTDKQIAALKYVIFNAKNGTDLSKRVLVFLIDQSKMLSRDTCLTLTEDREGYTAEEIHSAGLGADGMHRCNGTTHLFALLDLMGSDLHFSVHYGDYDPRRTGDPCSSAGQFAGFSVVQVANPALVREGMPMRYTFWLSKGAYSRQATLIVATRKELEQINIDPHSVYPIAEPA